MKYLFGTLFLLFIFFLVACKKNKKDTQPPVIVFYSPTSGQAFKMFDTLAVNVNVSDNEHLSFVNVVLTDLNHSPVQNILNIPVTSSDFTFSVSYYLTQYHLPSGNYYLQITASDGYNTTASYQSIYITESPTLWKGYCAVLKTNSQTILKYDSALQSHTLLNLTSPYNGMKFGGYNHVLYVNGSNTEPFQAYDMQYNYQVYNYSATPNEQNYTCLNTDGNKPFIGFTDGEIISLTNNGTYSTSYRLNDINFYPYYVTSSSLYGLAAFKSKSTTASDKMVVFNGATGYFLSGLPLGSPNCPIAKILAIFEKSADSLYVAGNDASGQAQLYYYTPSSFGFSNAMPATASLGKMISVAQVNAQQVLIATTSGVYFFGSATSNAIQVLSILAQKLVYQPKLNRLTLSNSTSTSGSISAYAVGTNSLTPVSGFNVNCNDSIIDFEVITNK